MPTDNSLYIAALGAAGAALTGYLGHMKGRGREKVDVGLAQAELAVFITEQNQKCQADLAQLRTEIEQRTQERRREHDQLRTETEAIRVRLTQCEEKHSETAQHLLETATLAAMAVTETAKAAALVVADAAAAKALKEGS